MIRCKHLTIAVCISILIGCSEKRPSDIMDQQQMQLVLTDMLIAESFAESFLLMDTAKTKNEWFSGELEKVLKVRKISQEQFRRSLEYYKSRPDLFKVIVDSMNTEAQRRRVSAPFESSEREKSKKSRQ